MIASEILQVGENLPGQEGVKNPKKMTYPKVETDYDGWADPNRFLPAKYDLVALKTSDGTKMGWHTGHSWDGMRVSDGDIVKYWKKTKEIA